MSLTSGENFAGFTIVRLLGAGGMGEVYLAEHPRLPRRDALKILPVDVSGDQEYRQRFHREAELAASLWNPHIVAVHDRGEHSGQLWISMDYVDGSDAGQLLRSRYPAGMPRGEVIEIVAAVAEALDCAHDNGLLHRDVKPANILVTQPATGARRILLTDFGIARQLDDISGLTATNMTVGTVSYAAPEQLMDSPIDGRADQYSLAATAYHLLCGAPPFQHSNPAVVIGRHLNAAPPRLGDTRPELADLDPVLARALSKRPDDRFECCADFAAALGSGSNTSAELTRPAAATGVQADEKEQDDTTRPADGDRAPSGGSPARGRWMRSGVVVPAVLALLVVGVLVFVGIQLGRNRQSAPPTAAPAPSSPSSPAPRPAPPPPAQAPTSTSTAAVAGPATEGVDPSRFGPAVGSDCNHSQMNVTTISNSGEAIRCVSGAGGFTWQRDTGEQVDPIIVGQQGWDNCLKTFPEAKCAVAAATIAGAQNVTEPVYPPGTYRVPSAIPYGTYGASIDYGTGQFSDGIAANPCTYATYDAAGNSINTGTFNSYSQAPPQVEIDRHTTLFRTSGCTPWAQLHP